jgi:hypothetical protein
LIAAPAAVIASVALAWLLWPRTAITRQAAARIAPGLSLAEVNAILGGPARDETTGPVGRLDPPEFALPDARGIRWRISIGDLRPGLQRWQSDEASVWVHFDDEGRVTDCHTFPMRRVEEGALDRLRRWLPL